MAVADFSLPAWLNQDNTMLVPDAMAKGAAVGTSIAHAMQGAAQVRQAHQRLKLMQAEDARQQAEFQQKAQHEAMRYQGFQNFARDREILKSTGKMTEEQASQQALMKNLHLITAGDPRALAGVMDRSADNERQSGMLYLQRSRLDEAERAARERERLGGENLELKSRGLNERISYHDESIKNKTDFENLRQSHRKEIIDLKAKPIMDKLSDTDRIAMQGEMNALQFRGLSQDELEKEVDSINAKYEAKKRGDPKPEAPWNKEKINTIKENLAAYDAKKGVSPKSKLSGAATEIREDIPANIHTPTTKEEMSAVPSGEIYRNPADGKLYRKK